MTIIDAFYTLFFSLGIVYIVLFRFKQYRMDKFRQSVFRLRDELFDYAADGNVSFDHPAYRTLRDTMNGYIRFSHRISLLQVCLTKFILGRWNHSHSEYRSILYKEVWDGATKDLDVKVKQRMDMFLFRASAQLFYYIFLSSTIKKIFVAPSMAAIFLKYYLNLKKEEKKSSSVNLPENKAQVSADLEEKTFAVAEQQSQHVKDSIDLLNADAFIFGSKRSAARSHAVSATL